MKLCKSCNIEKEYDQFPKNKQYPDGLLYKCKDCFKIDRKKYYEKNKDRAKLYNELRNYLESKFESWMTWENYGKYNGELNYGWDIDHIIPSSSAKTEEDVIKLNHYSNLQPLCSYINRYVKMSKLDYISQCMCLD